MARILGINAMELKDFSGTEVDFQKFVLEFLNSHPDSKEFQINNCPEQYQTLLLEILDKNEYKIDDESRKPMIAKKKTEEEQNSERKEMQEIK